MAPVTYIPKCSSYTGPDCPTTQGDLGSLREVHVFSIYMFKDLLNLREF